jgi:hypothetical protein
MIAISQSFLKAFNDMRLGNECGLVVKAKYIDKTLEGVPSEVMELGHFFEFMATGSLPRDGRIPQAKLVNQGKPSQRLSDDYQRAMDSAMYFKEVIQYYGINIVETGKVITQQGMTGILDILANWNNRVSIIDTKYSGLLEDRWNDMGWHIDSLPDKHKLMIQGVHYKILMSLKLGCDINDIDFYFFVFDSKNPRNAKIIKQEVDELTLQQHLKVVEFVKKELEKPHELVFKPRPSLKLCNDCLLRNTCDFKVEFPEIEHVLY